MASQKSLKDKELALLEKIQVAKGKLAKLQQKRKIEIGQLAIKYGLNAMDNAEIESHFKSIASELANADV